MVEIYPRENDSLVPIQMTGSLVRDIKLLVIEVRKDFETICLRMDYFRGKTGQDLPLHSVFNKYPFLHSGVELHTFFLLKANTSMESVVRA